MKILVKGTMAGLLLPSLLFAAERADPRLRSEPYDAKRVTTLYAKRGVTTHIQLENDEQIEYVSTGVGSDCTKSTDTWCVIAPLHGSQLFVKPKSEAAGSNNLAVATNRRAYSLRFVMVADEDDREPVYRLTYTYTRSKPVNTPPPTTEATQVEPALNVMPMALPLRSTAESVEERLQATPQVRNSNYTMKVGRHSGDIAPVLVFDDGRFTYFRYPNNRELPAVFQVGDDGQENVVNVHMETDPVTGRKDLLCADAVAKRFYLRRGQAVIGIWNESFDLDGVPPQNGTSIAGVERLLRTGSNP